MKRIVWMIGLMPAVALAEPVHQHWHSVPEPGTLALALLGGVVMWLSGSRR